MSVRFVALCALGLAGSLFVGYCVYFDKKRRSDPNYKKKVLAREKNIQLVPTLLHVCACREEKVQGTEKGD